MDFDVHIPVGVDLFLSRAFGVIMMKINRLQMPRRFALLAQAVIHADQEHPFDA